MSVSIESLLRQRLEFSSVTLRWSVEGYLLAYMPISVRRVAIPGDEVRVEWSLLGGWSQWFINGETVEPEPYVREFLRKKFG
jgi:hypothetical protein